MECDICHKEIPDTFNSNGIDQPCLIEWTWHKIVKHGATE